MAALPELYSIAPVEEFPAKALRAARSLLGGDKAVWTEGDQLSGDFRFLVDPVPGELAQLASARERYMSQHPVLHHVLATRTFEPRLISDFLSRTEFHRLGVYGEFFRPLGVEDQITVTVTPRTGRHLAGVSVDRGRLGFDDGDRRLLAMLRPHLVTAYDNARRFSKATSNRGADSDDRYATAVGRLTSRQVEVLALIAGGRTNSQIAVALGVSFDTVRKHVENILARLGVSNRTTAAVYYARHQEEGGTCWTATVDQMI